MALMFAGMPGKDGFIDLDSLVFTEQVKGFRDNQKLQPKVGSVF